MWYKESVNVKKPNAHTLPVWYQRWEKKRVFILEAVWFRRRRYNLTQMFQFEATIRWDFHFKNRPPMNIKTSEIPQDVNFLQ